MVTTRQTREEKCLRVAAGLRQLRLLTTSQIWQLWWPDAVAHRGGDGTPSAPTTVMNSLRWLEKAGLAARWKSARRGEDVWYLTRRGWETTRGEGDDRPYCVPLEKANDSKNDLLHTLGVNDLAVAFVNHARASGDGCDPTSFTHEVGHHTSHKLVVADALVRWESQGDLFEWLLEYQRDKATPRVVAEKLTKYHTVAHYCRRGESQPAWEHQYPGNPPWFPHVLIVLSGWPGHQTSEARMASILLECRRRELLRREDPPVWFATLEDALREGPRGHVWQTVCDPERGPLL